ncbi:MAG: peptidylprolyl isomerase [Calothrix sp. C42_A2020_038]|nr:peptidylprolyl isomerase [Calothrix sp. C42_A2020_038]
MSQVVTVKSEDIIRHIKLSCQIPDVLQAIAIQKIIIETADQVGIKVEPQELQQAGDNLRVAKKLVKAADTIAWLTKHHLSVDEFEELVYANVLAAKLSNHLFAKQVESFFFAHQLDYVAAVTYEVVLDDEDLAWEIFYALQERETTWIEVARQFIQNPEQRRAWGYQGIRHRLDFRPEIASSIFAASSTPVILKPIVTAKKVYLIWVEEIIHPKLDEQLRAKIQQDLFSAWLNQQVYQLEILIQ